MADRFPAIEDLDSSHENKGNNNNNNNNNNKSSGADLDFLSRERELLGDHAAEFATPNDNMASATVDDGIDDFFIGGGNQQSSSAKEFSAFESSFPNIDAGSIPGRTITSPPQKTSQPAPSPSYHGKPEEGESEPIKQWRIRRDQEIEQRAKLSASKKETTIASAKKWTDDFYEGYNRKKDQSIARARKEAEAYIANREDTTAGGTSWERVAKLVDLSGKGTRGGAAGTGKEKFRELLLGLKADKQAPGAGGYSSALVD